MNKNKEMENRTIAYILIFLLFVLLLGYLWFVIYNYSSNYKEGMFDFVFRYQESMYLKKGYNPFDVISKKVDIDNEIGALPKNVGYPPWSMAMGIFTNFTMLPVKTGIIITTILMITFFIISSLLVYFYCYKKLKLSIEYSMVCSLCCMCISGFYTGFHWLNIGAVIGVLLFLIVLFEDMNQYIMGIILAVSAIKPVLAAPFFLAVLLRQKWKAIIVSTCICLFFWGLSSYLTKTNPILFLQQMKEQGNTYWNNSLFTNIGAIVTGVFPSTKVCSIVSPVISIGIAIFLWVLMKRNSIENRFVFYSVPAVLSGMWMYSQEHDRTVLLIFLIATFECFINTKTKSLKLILIIAILSIVIYKIIIVNLLNIFFKINAYWIIDLCYDIVMISALIVMSTYSNKNLSDKKEERY